MKIITQKRISFKQLIIYIVLIHYKYTKLVRFLELTAGFEPAPLFSIDSYDILSAVNRTGIRFF